MQMYILRSTEQITAKVKQRYTILQL